ncbi:DUF4365 domain-containing protein [Pedobacter hiemivivus]|uniref:DUF4365 domain-containing protein n=1 Tax=Pedobacter hiemivivus TaxID=2530454 RepID=A0A4R0NIH3_9SPHI|nr:DUF4365 domain-containing protein [Pedobacter hiemivivus]TCC99162.1 DUF4365 domain-containing protein [Pedobacter hiemivivus]
MHRENSKLPLPSSSPNEDLETISKNKLSLLFDVTHFELRMEITRDKGVDLFAELKQNGFYTNFRLALQLKSTISIKKNTDGSISFPVEVSNINYLLNLSIPAYYILYDHNEEVFYYEKVFAVYQSLLKKYNSKNIPSQFKIRFSKILTPEVISEIYTDTLNRGNLYRKINPHLEHAEQSKIVSGIVIDHHNEVYNIDQNISYLEQWGLALINDAAFNTITEIEQRSHPRNDASAMFNLICGVAYYYKGKVFRAIEFLRLAAKGKAGFDPVLKSMLSYTMLQAEHEAGIVTVRKLKSKTLLLMEGDDIGSFLEVQKAWKELDNNNMPNKEKMQEFYASINGIIGKEPRDYKARVMAYSKVIEADLLTLIFDLGKNLFTAICTRNERSREVIASDFADFEKHFHSRMDSLMDFIGKSQDLQAMANVSLMKMEWYYRKAFVFHFYDHWDFSTLTSEGELSAIYKKDFDKHLGFLNDTIKLLKQLGQEENMLMSLRLKYRILHFMNDPGINEVLKEMNQVTAGGDFTRMRKLIKKMINKGTDHEIYCADTILRLRNVYTLSKNEGIEQYLFKNIEGDDLERNANVDWSISKLMDFDFSVAYEAL